MQKIQYNNDSEIAHPGIVILFDPAQ